MLLFKAYRRTRVYKHVSHLHTSVASPASRSDLLCTVRQILKSPYMDIRTTFLRFFNRFSFRHSNTLYTCFISSLPYSFLHKHYTHIITPPPPSPHSHTSPHPHPTPHKPHLRNIITFITTWYNPPSPAQPRKPTFPLPKHRRAIAHQKSLQFVTTPREKGFPRRWRWARR